LKDAFGAKLERNISEARLANNMAKEKGYCERTAKDQKQ
jgi:hypothetical protein